MTQGTKQPQPSQSTVSIKFRGQKVVVPRATKLRTALLKSGLTPHSEGAVYINCRGIGSCGTCAVEIRGVVEPSSWTVAERLRLNFPPHSVPNNSRLRLACQVSCMGDLEVVKYDKFWGEGNDPLPDLQARPESVTPLGALEFILDGGAASDASSASSGSSIEDAKRDIDTTGPP
ncbi:hypothetical protein VOLCADRAFT_75978 [Volvox carteri f. nagariensis]|uniref:2Fe-2S ferredoxin-type domain-containing protein n=1 Tax=Volvox carteri f. nagariensis TaxID=3068 RepID=D8U555_VOLCA|nr:uncharacterized protein VOLCADRAFT_75978 [Volvox carteri f. nagariensis]EFJ45088.1 hypothetical protein VOLCADRAFT_75978 [Volvox carteri f. nagariensis]|eukprot:XP_002953764.1 hypothetical protein VOLCADRAFT_75978 [Volvox carteri f. nagariensis]